MVCDSCLSTFCYPTVAPLRYMADPISDYSLLSWNVRGLNNPARQESVKQVIQVHKPLLLCLQETKLNDITRSLVANILANDCFWFLPADDTRGGILLAIKGDSMQVTNTQLTANTISATIYDCRTLNEWTITGVYGPQLIADKKVFPQELRALKQSSKPAWLLVGDFNLIYRDADKSNGHLDRRMMDRFRRALNHILVKEIPLLG